MPQIDLLAELRWRGLEYQSTEGLSEHLSKAAAGDIPTGSNSVPERGIQTLHSTSVISGYCGFDPTAPSLHVGHLVQIMGLVHLQRAGHRPIALVGGGTGMIGDPSGRSSERNLQTPEQVQENVRGIRSQLARYISFDERQTGDAGVEKSGNTAGRASNSAILVDNAEWLTRLNAIEFMRDIGKHFTINYMLAKDSVKSRLETGLSFTEFTYMLLQAYDFLQLNQRYGVTLQTGGSDQWGNITAGIELVRRAAGKEVHGVTLPLVTTASGTKFGKSEGGAIWLDAQLTSPYKFYQFWINTDDRDVGKYLKFFTLKSQEEIAALEESLQSAPEKREAHIELARTITTATHGEAVTQVVEEASSVLFAKKDPRTLSSQVFDALSREIPSVTVTPSETDTVLDLFVASGLVKSKGEGRRLADQGGTYINGERSQGQTLVSQLNRLAGSHILLRKGGRDYAVVKIT